MSLEIVDEGEVNWCLQLHQMETELKFFGPVLLEINPSQDIFDNLLTSWEFLRRCGWRF